MSLNLTKKLTCIVYSPKTTKEEDNFVHDLQGKLHRGPAQLITLIRDASIINIMKTFLKTACFVVKTVKAIDLYISHWIMHIDGKLTEHTVTSTLNSGNNAFVIPRLFFQDI